MRETVERKTGGTSKVERGDSVRRASAAGVSGTARPRPRLAGFHERTSPLVGRRDPLRGCRRPGWAEPSLRGRGPPGVLAGPATVPSRCPLS